jgi:CHAT domain-containing protein/tetratricopeptide (TPR) repeat protein
MAGVLTGERALMLAGLVPLVSAVTAGALFQTAAPTERLVMLAETAATEVLLEEVRLHPEQARLAFRDLLRGSATEPSPAAARLATAYTEVWTDRFLLASFERFEAWSIAERRHKLAADSLRDAGNAAYTEVGVAAALDLWRRSLAGHEQLGDTTGIARSLGNIGAAFYGTGKLDSAGAYYERSRQLATGIGDFVTAANALTMLATIDKETGNLPGAGRGYLRALEMHQRIGAVRSEAADRHNLGLLALSIGDVAAAKREFATAIELSRRTGYADDEADHLSSLADVRLAEGAYADAEQLLRRALTLDEETGNRLGQAGVHHSLGVLGMARGDYGAAVTDLMTALEIFEAMDRSANAVSVRADLGRARAAAGDIRGGLAELRTATRAAEAAQVGASVLADLALAHGDLSLLLNDYATARDRYARAERSYRTLDDYRGVAAALHGQAFVHAYQDESNEALSLLERSLRTQERSGDARAAALTRMLVADVHANAGDLASARAAAAEAVDAMRALGDPIGEAAALAVLGSAEASSGFAHTADSLYGVGLSRLGARGAPDIAWRLHAGRADLARTRGRATAAAESYRKAIRDIESSVGPGSSVGRVSGYLADKWEVYAALADVARQLGDDVTAFETSERLRAQRLLTLLDHGWVRTARSDSGLARQEQDLRRRIATLTTRLGVVERSVGSLRGPGAVGLSREDVALSLERAQREYAGLAEEMWDADLSIADVVRPTTASWSAIAERLRENETLLEYLISDSAAMVFVISKSGMRVLELDEPRDALADLVGFTRGVLIRGSDARGPELWRAPLERLYQLLVAPVEGTGALNGVEHIIIAPHGELHYLPFHALIGPSGAFLIERFTVSYTPSAPVWVRLFGRSVPTTEGKVLALAPRVVDLPGTQREIEAVRRVYADAVTLQGSDATEWALRTAAGPFRVIHLATYGVLNRANPLFSYIDLNPGGGYDGRLEVHEVFGLTAAADLVVLSACETGLAAGSRADVPPGDDWVGLARSFLSAGASNVVATLWRVEDEATAALVAQFYRAMGGGASVREALAGAQRKLLVDPRWVNPFYWAGFVLVGAGRGGT